MKYDYKEREIELTQDKEKALNKHIKNIASTDKLFTLIVILAFLMIFLTQTPNSTYVRLTILLLMITSVAYILFKRKKEEKAIKRLIVSEIKDADDEKGRVTVNDLRLPQEKFHIWFYGMFLVLELFHLSLVVIELIKN